MGAIVRGIRNSVRSVSITISICAIMGICIGLALVMALSVNVVQQRIDSVKSQIGNTITLSPAGAQFGMGGAPLDESLVSKAAALPHVVNVTKTFSDRLSSPDITLSTSVDSSAVGGGMGGVSMPVFITGIDDADGYKSVSGHDLTMVSGSTIDMTRDSDTVLIGKGLADANNLQVGSTFTAYKTKVTVKGIFTTGNMWGDNVVVFPLKTVQRLSGQVGTISMAVIQVDSMDNIPSVQQDVQQQVGSGADITTTKDIYDQAVSPLNAIKDIASRDLIGALIVGAIVVFLSMLLIVRERRREIGILKAIGASNLSVGLQFIAESLSLAAIGSVVGMGIGALLNDRLFSQLVSGQVASASGGGPVNSDMLNIGFKAGWGAFQIAQNATKDLHSMIGLNFIALGLIIAIVIAASGGVVPAIIIARMRPANNLRNG